MGSLGSGEDRKKMVVTQISIGGFRDQVGLTAKELTDFLEAEAGLIWRCRLKNSWTPPDSYPDFRISDFSKQPKMDDYKKVESHAFVHFTTPDGAKRAINASGQSKLILNGSPLKVNSGADSSFQINQRRATKPFVFSNACVEIGTLVAPDEFWCGWKGPESGIDFLIDPFHDCCKIIFSKEVAFSFDGTNKVAVLKCDFKVEFLMREINDIRVLREHAPFSIIFHLMSSPILYYRTAEDDIFDSAPYILLDDEDPWIRTSDFTQNGVIGRCNSYRVSFSPRFGGKLETAIQYITERRISASFPRRELLVKDEPQCKLVNSYPLFSIQHQEGISFEIMFLINAVLHKGIINQYELSDDFFGLLKTQSDVVNATALLHIYSYKKPIFDAHKRMKLVQSWLLKNPKLLKSNKLVDDNVEVRRLVITPTKGYCLPPEVELSNRVLRKYKDVADRFLRVTFTDEGMQQLNSSVLTYYVAPIVRDITSNSFPQKTNMFKRVKNILTDGFHLCGRHYSFLAFSSNQLRDRSAWFFAENESLNVNSIRDWMGKFSSRNVAKYSARMGQCFSSTYATVDVPRQLVNHALPDIERNEYTFSDGIGKIAPELANEVAERLQLKDNPPSAYQIRYAGCKGVVAVWPGDSDGIKLQLRKSMSKFESTHTVFEVVSWTRFQPCFLNRQIVTLLSALGVPDHIFSEMQDSMVYKLDQMLTDSDMAFEVLTTSCTEHGNTAAMMLSAGFRPQSEPHLKGMLSCLRSAQLTDLLSKARIFVRQGRWLMGCLDELAVLESGQCFIQASVPSLENCFARHGSKFANTKKTRQIIQGTVVIAKNPCLHPGDVRILEAVDVPGLHHLVDCLVFPQNGDRPHANEASGSDLDGDLYFVAWEENLIPPSKKSWAPMDYSAAEAKQQTRDVKRKDVIDFFTKNMVSENLGVICNAHVVHADLSAYGAFDEKCLHLAELAAIAVDFPKTGKGATMPQSYRPKTYPDFMGKEDFRSYKSEKILGKLYRKIKNAYEEDGPLSELYCSRNDIPYDLELEVLGASTYIWDAWKKKCSYDGQLNALLGQYKVQSEGEVVTGYFWTLPKHNSRKQGDLKERLKNAYSALHKEFRQSFECLDSDTSEAELTEEEKSVLYEQKASAWYQVTYHPRWLEKAMEHIEPDGEAIPIRLSFAWIAADYLVRIKVRHRGREKLDGKKPIDSLAQYLLEKI